MSMIPSSHAVILPRPSLVEYEKAKGEIEKEPGFVARTSLRKSRVLVEGKLEESWMDGVRTFACILHPSIVSVKMSEAPRRSARNAGKPAAAAAAAPKPAAKPAATKRKADTDADGEKKPKAKSPGVLKVGDPLPALTLKTDEGKDISTADLSDAVIFTCVLASLPVYYQLADFCKRCEQVSEGQHGGLYYAGQAVPRHTRRVRCSQVRRIRPVERLAHFAGQLEGQAELPLHAHLGPAARAHQTPHRRSRQDATKPLCCQGGQAGDERAIGQTGRERPGELGVCTE